MIDYLRDHVDGDLTAFVRRVPNRADFMLTGKYLPAVKVNSPKYRVNTAKVKINAAQRRAHNTPAPYSQIEATRSVTEGYFPPIGGKTAVEEFEIIYQNIQLGAAQSELERAIYDNARNQTDAIWARLELDAGTLLATRKVEINENGFIQTISFDKADGKTIADDITANWTGASAKPLSDELKWIQALAAEGAPRPAVALASTALIAKMAAAKEYIALLYGKNENAPSRLSPVQLNQVRAEWGLATLVANDVQVFVDGKAQRVLPEDRLILLPEPGFETVGETQFGTTAEGWAMTSGSNPALVADEVPGIVSTKLVEQDPPTVITRTVAAALPVLQNPAHYVTAKIA